jgi:hypothetical protein
VELAPGTLAIADERRPLELLFGGAPTEELAAGSATSRTAIAAIQVKGVPDAAVEEALWIAAAAIEAG